MSNPAPWGQSIPGDQQGGGQITFFDPSKFQGGPQDFPNPADKQQKQTQPGHQNVHTANNQVSESNAWSTWSWGEASNPYANVQNSESNGMNYGYQNQWNGQQWSQQQQNGSNQFYWDPNTQQWQPNYVDHSQQGQQMVDQNQYGYQYWNAGVSQDNGTVTENSVLTNTVPDSHDGHQNSALESVQNSGFAHQESIRDTALSSSHVRNQPLNHSNHSNEKSPKDEYLSQSNSSYDQSQQDYLNQSVATTEGDESLDQSEGSVGRFFVNDYEGEGDLVARQTSIQSASSSEQQFHKNYETQTIENTNVSADHNKNSDSIHNHILGNEPGVPNEVNLVAQTVPLHNDHLSQNYNYESVGQSDQGYQYYAVDSQAQPTNVAKESEKEEEDISQPVKSETHSEDDWELVQPQGLGPASHCRTQSMDNNVHFFISSGNSSSRVSPSGSSKSKDELESISGRNESPAEAHSHTHGANIDSEKLRDKLETSKVIGKPQIPSAHNKNEFPGSIPPPVSVIGLSRPPPTSSLGPPPVGMGTGANPFRKSPIQADSSVSKADTPSPITQESLLSSTRLDTTKANFENSPVVLNQSISPIPPGLDIHTGSINNAGNNSPDIQELGKPGHNPDTPVSSANQRKAVLVPQSPIMHRKESPFQPPVQMHRNISDSRSKPIKASHSIPGVPAQAPQNSNAYNIPGCKTPDLDTERDGRKSGRKTPEWDSDRRGYERRTGRRTPDWDRDRTTDKNRGRRTPDWDSKQSSDRYGRRTPDWDREQNRDRNQGRRTPDWDSKQSSARYGRRTPDWDQSSDKENSRRYNDRRDDSGRRDLDEDRLSAKPPAGTSGASNKGMPPRAQSRQSAFRDMVKSRSKNNVSPATSLLDFEPPVVSNILLVPATAGVKPVKVDKSEAVSEDLPDLKPVASLISSLSEQINTDDSASGVKSQTKNRNDGSSEKLKSDNVREPNVRTVYDKNRDRDSRDTLRHNRSYERGLNDTRNTSREKLRSYGSRDSLENELQDDSRERHHRGNSRDRDRLDPYDRYYR